MVCFFFASDFQVFVVLLFACDFVIWVAGSASEFSSICYWFGTCL